MSSYTTLHYTTRDIIRGEAAFRLSDGRRFPLVVDERPIAQPGLVVYWGQKGKYMATIERPRPPSDSANAPRALDELRWMQTQSGRLAWSWRRC